MNKQVIFKPAKTYAFALKQAKTAVREIEASGWSAEELGIEILKVEETFYVVKNAYKPSPFDTIWSTNDASQRVSVAELMGRVGA